MIIQLLDSDWPANILANVYFQTQENGLMSPDGVCAISADQAAISADQAGHETILYVRTIWLQVFMPVISQLFFTWAFKGHTIFTAWLFFAWIPLHFIWY